jgi:hypothetical protein
VSQVGTKGFLWCEAEPNGGVPKGTFCESLGGALPCDRSNNNNNSQPLTVIFEVILSGRPLKSCERSRDPRGEPRVNDANSLISIGLHQIMYLVWVELG